MYSGLFYFSLAPSGFNTICFTLLSIATFTAFCIVLLYFRKQPKREVKFLSWLR